MINWLKSLYSKKQIRKTRVVMDADTRNNLVKDRTVNKFTYSQLAEKYNVSTSTAFKIVKTAMKRREIK